MSRILVIGGDRGVAARLEKPLERAGWEVLLASGATNARAALYNGHAIALVLLDISLPGAGGRELCREIRAANGPPVILVGGPDSREKLLEGLQLGADDCLAEPIATAELLARVNAALRRATQPAVKPASRRRIGPLTIDLATRRVTVAKEPVHLTPREYALLLALVEREGEVVTRDELFASVWGPGWLGTAKALDVQMSGLRRKLRERPGNPRLIHTVRGVGFLLTRPERAS
jgi:DNA-binding response OmpR family regulator